MSRRTASALRQWWGVLVAAAPAVIVTLSHAGPIPPGTVANWSPAFLTGPDAGPGGRQRHLMVYDQNSQLIVMAGGLRDGGFPIFAPTFLDDTWTTAGSGWALGGNLPSPVASPAAAYTNATSLGVLVSNGGTWNDAGYLPSFSGVYLWSGSKWTIEPASAPPARIGGAATFDPVRNVVVLFGGFDPASQLPLNDTWEWSAGTWTQRFPVTVPLARFDAAMAYDIPSSLVLMYGGDETGEPAAPIGSHACSAEMWAWDGGDWGPVSAGSATLGDNRCGASLVSDFTDGVTLLYGGLDVGGVPPLGGQLVAWNEDGWLQIPPGTGVPPVPRAYAGFAWTVQQLAGYVYGGAVQFGPLDPTTYKVQLQPPDGGPATQDAGGGSQDAGGGSQDAGGGSQDAGGGSQDAGGGSQDAGGGSQDAGGGSQDAGGGSQDAGGGSQDAGGGSQDAGGGSQDAGGGSQDAGGSQDSGTTDSGIAPDAGAPSDAGTVSDAGQTVPDSGQPQPDGGGADGGSFDAVADLGCGCGQGSAAGAAWLGLIAMLRIRRSRCSPARSKNRPTRR